MRKRLTIAILVLGACVAAAQTVWRPEQTEVWSPVPPRVAPGAQAGAPPGDAVMLFDGSDLEGWRGADGGPARWLIEDGVMIVAPGAGDIRTAETFGDVQLHVEWRTPILPDRHVGQDRGNSGVFLQERYEVQILDTLENVTYANGQAGAIYKQHAPLVNPARPAGEWQSYDIVFMAPRFGADGALVSPARMSVLFNGVLIHNDVGLAGATTFIGQPADGVHGPGAIQLQDHGHRVGFRNIWARRL